MSLRSTVSGILLLAACTSAHDVITTPITFSREISRLFYDRCVSCHHDGGTAFSLVTYEQARPWAKAIKEEVLERRMPPWGAVKGFGEFRDDRGLAQEQIEIIADWVEGGAPEGDPKLAPKIPELEKTAPAVAPRGVTVEGKLSLSSATLLTGIRAGDVAEGKSLMVVANRPDGSVDPLLWLYNYKPKFAHPYWFSTAIRLPKGTTIEIAPPEAGSVVLLTGKTKSATDEHR